MAKGPVGQANKSLGRKGGEVMISRMKLMVTAMLTVGLLTGLQAQGVAAAEVAGVNLADQIVLDGSGESLVLNRAGVRKKFRSSTVRVPAG